MKLSVATVLFLSTATNAFILPCEKNRVETILEMKDGQSRRQVFGHVAGMGGILLTNNLPSNAAVDQSAWQDLLPKEEVKIEPGKRPTYLKEPTAEFKENEEQAAVYRRKQIQMKTRFNTVLERFLSRPDEEQGLVSDLKEMRSLVIENGGLPIGLKKEELYKLIRAKKRKGFWPTDVEIAYQKLINEVIFQQSPNVEDKSGGMKYS